MPLSDRERKLLAEMEQALSADDPLLSSTLTGNRTFPGRTRVLAGVAALLAGLAIIMGGLISQTVPVGILGFVIALSGLFTVLSAVAGISRGPQTMKKSKNSGLRSRLEQRWDERNFEN